MKEAGFYIENTAHRISVEGGRIWEAAPKEKLTGGLSIEEEKAEMNIFLFPQSTVSELSDELYKQLKEQSYFHYLYFVLAKKLPSLILLVPITLTVLFIGFITIYGDLIKNWIFLLDDADTLVGLTQRESIVIYTVLAVLILYFFPVFLTGEQDGFIQAINELFSNKKLLQKRFTRLFQFLNKKGHIKKIVIWNPNLLASEQNWVQMSLIPAILNSGIHLELQVKTDERSTAEHYIRFITDDHQLKWNEYELTYTPPTHPIPYDYLENWEKKLLAIYVFASTANLPQSWKTKGAEQEGILENALSLPLVKILIHRFKDRLFSEEDRKHLISMDAFASRALNDFGILFPCLQYTSNIWGIEQTVVDKEFAKTQEELRFMTSFLQTEIHELTQLLDDPVSALLLNAQQVKNSIYNQQRLETIRFFIDVIHQSEQYKILKQYWKLIGQQIANTQQSDTDIFRIIGIKNLDKAATLFERAAMYQEAQQALEYLETVYPYRAKMGKARITERQGNFRTSVEAMLVIQTQWSDKAINLTKFSVIDLHLNLAWAIVSGRLEDFRLQGKQALENAQDLLYTDFDQIRNSEQIIRSYNILANYKEWEGQPEGAIQSYNKALQIPGVEQSSLSNLLVNKGIALRQIKDLQDATVFGEQGVTIKTAIGDADQLPIALHNLAQTYLELAFSLSDTSQKASLEKAKQHAQTGLDIQAETGSVKKRGQLLTELFVANYQLSIHNSSLQNEAKANWVALQTWLEQELDAKRDQSYDCRVILTELLGLLTNFGADNLAGAIKWQPFS
ncbi:MAG: hypothetical protein MK212_03215 [Saprospiraceae bacterium]|nr:hypothetical protein [Saprospiraceae bacterium]